ncbi:hypothetical protein [Hymenobacter weizhouensis]|uniref:hypothetical protein n=1 Tax=Hymenobacter sp. YIM 151500-1 TaxID=2987689 RepID=UPI00222616A3|nr:hypothetical protein [Hymenobacter sp. YIM 151500-1]UYZ61734.1 hypothetical protein OIS53_12050 [Hymenobacter sp. YIM 151500-1]
MQPAEKQRPTVALPPPPPPKPPRIYRLEHLDTLVQLPGRVLRIYPAARPVYEKLPAPAWVAPKPSSAEEEEQLFLDFAAEEQRRLAKAGARVRRTGRALRLRPTAAPEVRLVNNPVEDDRHVAYEYLASLPEVKQWLISVHLYEGGYYLLVDQRNGRHTQLMAPPAVSPDGRHFVCGNSDVLARFEPSGLQLWSAEGSAPHLLWERQTEWGCTNPRWLDNKTILFEQDFFDRDDVDTRVVRLKVIP